MAMTIGALSKRTGVPVKTLRKYEDLGLIFTAGRSPGNYRLFNEDALWCVGAVATLRGLGLTLAEIQELAASFLQASDEPIGPRLAAVLGAARCRAQRRIDEAKDLLRRIDAFEAEQGSGLPGENSS
ncbi:MAG: MerR family transcriptional regulator [Actinomycetota bacterium]